jgi:Mn-dependent DtxR family transcriptional regulator
MITITPQVKTEPVIEPLAVDTKTASRLLSVSPKTVDSLARKGLIDRKKIGWRSLYTMASIRRFLETSDND